MKILVISESINIEDSSASKANVALIHNLIKAGFQIKVLHFSHKVIDLKGVETVLIKENKWSLLFILSRLIRVFQRITNITINDSIEALFGFSFTHSNDTNSIANGIKKEAAFQPDLILTLSKGGSFRPHRAMLKLPNLYQKWVAYIHDPYPFHRYPRPYDWVEKSYKAKEEFMKQITEKAKHLAFPSLLLKEWMQSYFPAVAKKSIIIPHQINPELQLKKLPDFFVENQFSLLHAGNLLKERNPEFLIQGYLNFLEKNPQAKSDSTLYLIGHNSYHKTFLSSYSNDRNVVIKDYLEYGTIKSLENEVSVNIILEAISEISPFLPGKFPNCVISDKPIFILGPYYSEVKRLLGNNYPYWAEADNVMAIEKVITTLYELWKNNPKALVLNRQDLVDYSTEIYLKTIVESLK